MKSIKKLVFVVGLSLLYIGFQNSILAGELHITVEGAKNKKGTIQVAVYKPSDDFPNKNFFIGQRRSNPGSIVNLIFSDIPEGQYAIAVFHDENGNDELDTNFIGIPKEPYGFSNNASATFGPPSFEKAKIMILEKEIKKINIHL